MKKSIILAVLALGMFLGVSTFSAQASSLSQSQIQSILGLLSSFGANQGIINSVNTALNGQTAGTFFSPTPYASNATGTTAAPFVGVVGTPTISSNQTYPQNGISTTTITATFNIQIESVGGNFSFGNASARPFDFDISRNGSASDMSAYPGTEYFSVPSAGVVTTGLPSNVAFELLQNNTVQIPVTISFVPIGSTANYSVGLSSVTVINSLGQTQVVSESKGVGTPTISAAGPQTTIPKTTTQNPTYPTIAPSNQTISSGQTASLVYGNIDSSDFVSSKEYLSCPIGLSAVSQTGVQLCNTYFNQGMVPSSWSFTVTNSTSGALTAAPNFYIYYSSNPNYAYGGSASITVLPGPWTTQTTVSSEQATIDSSVFSQTSSTPVISGSASGLSQIGVVLSGPNSGDKAYGSSLFPVVNGRWSIPVQVALASGQYTIRVYDANNNQLASGSLTVTAPQTTTTQTTVQQPITVTYPQAGYSLVSFGSKDSGLIGNIQWTPTNQNLNVDIMLLSSNGYQFKTIADGVPDTGTYSWPYDATIPNGTYAVYISSSGMKGIGDGTSGYFTLVSQQTTSAPTPAPVTGTETITPSNQTVASGQSVQLNFTFPSNTIRASLYISCPSGVTVGGAKGNITGCNSYADVTNSSSAIFQIINNTSGSANVVPNYYIYTSTNPNFGNGVTSNITVLPQTSTPAVAPAVTPAPIIAAPAPVPTPVTSGPADAITFNSIPTSVAAGKTFSVVVTNSGTAAWGPNHYLELWTGDQAQNVLDHTISGTPSGGSATISFMAPTAPGTYEMRTVEQGVAWFGSNPKITVTAPQSLNQSNSNLGGVYSGFNSVLKFLHIIQ